MFLLLTLRFPKSKEFVNASDLPFFDLVAFEWRLADFPTKNRKLRKVQLNWNNLHLRPVVAFRVS